jgi:hypothetical protein
VTDVVEITVTNTLTLPQAVTDIVDVGYTQIAPGPGTGVVGPAGPRGDTGLTGPAGPTGATGAVGPTGSQGPTGPIGLTGSQGVVGPTGLTGLQGVKGDIGLSGPQGTKGDTGLAGSDGLAGVGVYPISGYGLISASGEPLSFFGSGAIGNNQAWLTRLWMPAGYAITNLFCAVRVGGTYSASSTPNQLALFDDSGNLISKTPDDSTLWTVAGWRGGAISAPVPAGVGRYVYIGLITGGMSNLFIANPQNAADNHASFFATGPGDNHKRCIYANATSLSSFNPVTYGTGNAYIPLVGIN